MTNSLSDRLPKAYFCYGSNEPKELPCIEGIVEKSSIVLIYEDKGSYDGSPRPFDNIANPFIKLTLEGHPEDLVEHFPCSFRIDKGERVRLYSLENFPNYTKRNFLKNNVSALQILDPEGKEKLQYSSSSSVKFLKL